MSLILLLLTSCSDHTLIHEKVITEENYYSNMSIFPDSLNFGSVAHSNLEKESFYITNTGNASFNIEQIDFNIFGNFEYNYIGNMTLEEGDSAEVEILYSPDADQVNFGQIIFMSDADNEQEAERWFAGQGLAPRISITPDIIDFGSVRLNCETEVDIEIKNIGSLELEIDGSTLFSSSPNNFILDNNNSINGSFDWDLDPGESLNISVTYDPTDIVSDSGEIRVASNDPQNSRQSVFLSGSSFYTDTNTDSFIQFYSNMSDVIIVVDNSGSMSRFHNNLSSNINNFINQYLSYNINFRIGIITTDSAFFDYNYVDNSTQSVSSYLSNWILNIGTNGSGTETGLGSLYRSFNFGSAQIMSRSNSNLAIIFISDEPDHSISPWGWYASYLDSLPQYNGSIIAHAVIGDYPNGCTLPNPNGSSTNAQFGAGYYEIANYYGGTVFSICSEDWGIQLSNLGALSVPQSSFTLTKDAVEGSITVKVDGTSTNNWSYDSSSNSVVFHQGMEPADGSSVEITYGMDIPCE